MKKTAIITGATGGLGQAFVSLLLKEDIDEIWAVARNTDKLNGLKARRIGGRSIVSVIDMWLQR